MTTKSPIGTDDDLAQILTADENGTTRHELIQYLTAMAKDSGDSSQDVSAQAYLAAADIVEKLGM